MRALLSIAVLMSALPAFADPILNVPEPESLALVAVGVVAMFLVRRNKK